MIALMTILGILITLMSIIIVMIILTMVALGILVTIAGESVSNSHGAGFGRIFTWQGWTSRGLRRVVGERLRCRSLTAMLQTKDDRLDKDIVDGVFRRTCFCEAILKGGRLPNGSVDGDVEPLCLLGSRHDPTKPRPKKSFSDQVFGASEIPNSEVMGRSYHSSVRYCPHSYPLLKYFPHSNIHYYRTIM